MRGCGTCLGFGDRHENRKSTSALIGRDARGKDAGRRHSGFPAPKATASGQEEKLAPVQVKHQDGAHRDVAGFIELAKLASLSRAERSPREAPPPAAARFTVREGALLGPLPRRRRAQQVRRWPRRCRRRWPAPKTPPRATPSTRRRRLRHARCRHRPRAPAPAAPLGDRARGRGGGRAPPLEPPRRKTLKSIETLNRSRREEERVGVRRLRAEARCAGDAAGPPPPPPRDRRRRGDERLSPGRRCPRRARARHGGKDGPPRGHGATVPRRGRVPGVDQPERRHARLGVGMAFGNCARVEHRNRGCDAISRASIRLLPPPAPPRVSSGTDAAL